MRLLSDAFQPDQPIPPKCTGEGPDVSPGLRWEGAPQATRAFALTVDDPDAPRAEPWVHWLVWNIPGDARSIEEGHRGATQGRNDFGQDRWGGPMPPRGHGVHHYVFTLYALDRPLDLPAGATRAELQRAMEGRVLATARLVGTYVRD